MGTLSMVFKYVNDLEEYLDDGDSMEAKKITVENSEKELEMFEELGHKSVMVEVGHADSHNYMTEEMVDKLGFVRADYGDYGRKVVKEVRVEIRRFTFLVDFVMIGYANEGEPSVIFGREFLFTSRSKVDFGSGEMRIDLTMLEEERDMDDLLLGLVENMEEVGMRGDGVASITLRRRDLYGDGVRILAIASRRGRLKEDLESSMWRRQNADPPPNNRPVLTATMCARAVQELHELQIISAFVDSRLESIEQFLNNFANHPNDTDMNDLESDDESIDTPLASPFPHSDNDLDNGEVLNELVEYENVGMIRHERAINSFDGDDLAFQCMIGFRKFVAYFDPFLPMNIITCKAYNTTMVEGLESTKKNLVAIVRDVYAFVGSFTYITDFVVLEDIEVFILINKAEVVMDKPFRKITKLEYDYAKGLMSFIRIFDNYTFQMPCTILRFKRWGNVSWSKISPILVLSQRDLTNGFKNAYEKNRFMYKNCLSLGPEYQVIESIKEWLIHGHMSIHEVT
nr:homeodomain-like protein [Tanacetum cinerariifolium]